jgi:diacylglycerol kinase (ATP)
MRARRADRGESLVLQALQSRGIAHLPLVRVNHPRGIVEAVDALLDQGVVRLIVGGGDGTLSAVASRLARRPVELGVMPLGTANDFARTLGIPTDLEGAAEIVARGKVRLIDLARANDAYFLNVASIGMSVSVTAGLSLERKRWFGSLAYLYGGFLAFTRNSAFQIRVQNGTDSIETTAYQFIVGNGRFYGGGVLVSWASSLEDGMLHAYALGTRGRWQLLRTIALLRMGAPIIRPGDSFLQTSSLHVETWPSKRVNCDGEIRTRTPVTFTVEPGALRVLAPH